MAEHNYTAKDFERYHSGQMPEVEMHALERLALEDPFLADALEGYHFTETPIEDVAELREQLSDNKKKKRLFFLQNKVWLRIAASIILIGGIGYLIYQPTSRKEDLLARNEVKEKSLIKDSPISVKSDTNKNNGTAALANASQYSTKLTQQGKTGYFYQQQVKRDVAVDSLLSNKADATVSFSKDANESYLKDMKQVEGKVVDDQGNPVAQATVKDNERKVSTVTDSAGKFKLAAKDSNLNATIAAVGYKTKQSELSPSLNKTIVLEPAHEDLKEVVVTAQGTRRSKKELGYSKNTIADGLAGKVAGVSVTSANDSIYRPNGGWQKFNQYILDNIGIPINKAGEKYKGKVVLSFEVNKRGNPGKVKTEQSLCVECDKEATRLLLRGPKWKYAKNKRYSIDIKF